MSNPNSPDAVLEQLRSYYEGHLMVKVGDNPPSMMTLHKRTYDMAKDLRADGYPGNFRDIGTVSSIAFLVALKGANIRRAQTDEGGSLA